MIFTEILDSMKNEIICKTQEIIRIKSVESSAKPGMPFGVGVNDALEYALELCENLGFKTKNIDGYAGHADFGEGDETVGVLVHLDVVPEGNSDLWTYPPYEAVIQDGKLYGRGAIDDKGPAIAAIYAIKALKDSSVKLKKKIRIIFGTDEESGWECMRYYLQKEKSPDIAFTPDANYPVIYAEKGILTLSLKQKFISENESPVIIKYIKGGEFANVVPNFCEALLYIKGDTKELYDVCLSIIEKEKYSIDLLLDKNHLLIKSHGIASHAFMPEKGKNAISQLMKLLSYIDSFSKETKNFIEFYNEKIGMQLYGTSLGCEMEDEDSGKLTLNVGIINFDENTAELILNIRYPVTEKMTNLVSLIEKNLEKTNITIDIKDNMNPLFIPKDSEVVQKLTNVYKKIMNDDTPPQSFGGGTYARAIKNAVAFGAVFPNEPILAHQIDEYIKIDHLLKNAEIMTYALYELAR